MAGDEDIARVGAFREAPRARGHPASRAAHLSRYGRRYRPRRAAARPASATVKTPCPPRTVSGVVLSRSPSVRMIVGFVGEVGVDSGEGGNRECRLRERERTATRADTHDARIAHRATAAIAVKSNRGRMTYRNQAHHHRASLHRRGAVAPSRRSVGRRASRQSLVRDLPRILRVLRSRESAQRSSQSNDRCSTTMQRQENRADRPQCPRGDRAARGVLFIVGEGEGIVHAGSIAQWRAIYAGCIA